MNVLKAIEPRKKKWIMASVAVVAVAAIAAGTVLACSGKGAVRLSNYKAVDSENPFTADVGYRKPEVTLDGSLSEAQWQGISELKFGEGVSASVKGFYGKNGIYIGATISDADIWTTSANVYDNSSFEIYLDYAGTGGKKPGGSNYEIFVDAKEQSLVRKGNNGVWIESDLIKSYGVSVDGTLNDSKADKGYTVEMYIPYSQLGGTPQVDYGIAFGIVTCKSGTRSAWTGINGVDVQTPDTYYKFYRNTNTIEATRKVNHSEITIDGKDSESQWSGRSSYVYGDGGRASVKTFFGNNGLYLYFDVADDKVYSIGSAPYQNDSVEVYLDTLGNGGTAPKNDDVQVRADVGGTIEFLRGNGTGWADAVNNVFSGSRVIGGSLNGAAKGYNIELFIPWSDLGMTVAPGSMKISFGAVDYDGAKKKDGSRDISWSGTGKDPQVPNNYIKITSAGIEGAKAEAPSSEVVLNGQLSESQWTGAPSFTYHGGQVTVNWFWTDKGCYFGFTVKDSCVKTDGTKPFQNSSVELYLDYNKKGGSPNDTDRTILVDAAGNMLFRKGVNGAYQDFGTRSISSGVTRTGSGYVVELFVPWSEFGGGRPSKMGIAFGQVNRASSAKETTWTSDGLCTDPQKPSGYSEFTSDRIGKQQAKPTIVLDGKDSDSIWSGRSTFTYGNNNSVSVRHVMDSSGLSLFFNVTDPDVWANSSKIFENDGVEIYLDALNNRGAKPQKDDYQIRIDASGNMACLQGTGSGWTSCANIAQAAVSVEGTINDSKSDTGYTVEVFIPWSSIGLSGQPNSVGVNFGQPRKTKGTFEGWSGTGNDPQIPNTYYTLSSSTIQK